MEDEDRSPSKGLGLQKFCCEQELKDKARTHPESTGKKCT